MGTTIMFSPLLHSIKKHIPNAKITVLVGSNSTSNFLQNNPNVDNIIVWDFFKNGKLATIKFLLELRRKKFDLSLNVYPNLRKEHNVVAYLIGSKYRLSHDPPNSKFSRLYFLINKRIPINFSVHDIENNKNLLHHIGIDTEHQTPFIYLSSQNHLDANKFLSTNHVQENQLLVGARVGDLSSTEGRNWSPEKFSKLFRLLIQQKIKIIIFSNSQDHDIIKKLDADIKDKLLIYENPDIRNVAALIEKCHCFISDDSGLMHVASSVNTPIVALFGPTNQKWTSPISKNYKIITSDMDCSPCLNRINPPSGHDSQKFNLIQCHIEDKFACMKNLSENDVFFAVTNFLKTNGDNKSN
jgi:heptosyltransferase-2